MLSAFTLAVGLAVTTAAAGGRPPECADGRRQANAWERAKSPLLGRYCELLAGASSKLAGPAPAPGAALDAAAEAERLLPGGVAAMVLEGRALAALGRVPEAFSAFQLAKARGPSQVLEGPAALLALARVLAAMDRPVDARQAYRSLMPRATSWASSERASVALEAGLTAMRLGPEAIDESVADLHEALRLAQGDAEAFVVLALALALDRASRGDEARALLAERLHGDPRLTVDSWASRAPVPLAASEAAALSALALETSDVVGAREGWGATLEASPSGPWAPHARARLAALYGGRTLAGPRAP